MTKLIELEMKKKQLHKMMEKFQLEIDNINKLIKQIQEEITNE